MKTPIMIIWMGNLIDLAATLCLTELGYQEANPFMAALLPYPALFATVKIGAMAAATWILWRNRGYRSARVTAWVAAGLYGGIAVYYLAVFPMLVW